MTVTWNPSLIDGPIPVPIYGDETTDEDGVPYRPITGWRSEYHVNVPAELLTEALAVYAVTPDQPARVFMGGDTAFLRFADEAEACAALPGHWTDETG